MEIDHFMFYANFYAWVLYLQEESHLRQYRPEDYFNIVDIFITFSTKKKKVSSYHGLGGMIPWHRVTSHMRVFTWQPIGKVLLLLKWVTTCHARRVRMMSVMQSFLMVLHRHRCVVRVSIGWYIMRRISRDNRLLLVWNLLIMPTWRIDFFMSHYGRRAARRRRVDSLWNNRPLIFLA
jgi:hypothetical protein